ncbi:hypothetical protein GCM10011575_31220 [Microlunatus endophyticus]|uniref:N-acetyltransferase domain-containing protein n=1 Tax=Microlunatus endophyticus TaxID=1716077 RepID=A0A917W718_9ACTN|nr:GNAT family N-acetyltransferase [Microlunatus endophyticus]GGL70519.1 hypothetical protein GCM10011575_31220 [Microlunatus endophyticus]
MNQLRIRILQSSDLPVLAALRCSHAEEQKGLSAASDLQFGDRFSEWYRNTAAVSRWQVADTGVALVGLLHMFTHFRMPMPTYDSGGWGYVSLLYVQPEHRGTGIGGRLLRTIEQDALSLGFSKLLLNPTDKAIPLYRRCGYRPADSYMVHDLGN